MHLLHNSSSIITPKASPFCSFLFLSWPTLIVNQKLPLKSVGWCHSPPLFFILPTKGHEIGICFVKFCVFSLPNQGFSGHYLCEKSGIILSLFLYLSLKAWDLKQNQRNTESNKLEKIFEIEFNLLWACAAAPEPWPFQHRYICGLGCLRTILSARVP